ncbi:uncharacterized protein LOC136004664 [Lathamus discolor]|uniref:uncharacterized protein LOC136004664 n=1 Tax=Lathamus discolor TaxID=678569 RepID=UPI0032B7CFBF
MLRADSRRLPAWRSVRRRGARCGSGAAPGAAPGGGLPAPLGEVPGAAPGAAPGVSQCGSRSAAGAADPRGYRTAGPEPSFPRPGSMPRGRAWTQAEVSSLLALVGDSGEAALLMASTSRPNEALWKEISQGLAAAGYSRSVAQCRSKWKALKQAFHSERETRLRAGLHSDRLPPHYRAMKSLWKAAGRPVFRERRMPDIVKLPSGKRRSAHAAYSSSSPEPPEHNVDGDTPDTLMSPLLQCAKNKPETRPIRRRISPLCSLPAVDGDHIAGGPPAPHTVPHTSHCFPSLPFLGCHVAPKPEGAEQKAAGFPGETSPGMARGSRVLPAATTALCSPGMAAVSEQPAAGEEASGSSLHGGSSPQHPNVGLSELWEGFEATEPLLGTGSGVTSLLQSMQQLLAQILHTSQQQQALLESLATDTISYLHLLSHRLVQVGETLHQLLLRPQTHPGTLGHYIPHVPPFEAGPRVPCSPGDVHEEELQGSPDTGCIPP